MQRNPKLHFSITLRANYSWINKADKLEKEQNSATFTSTEAAQKWIDKCVKYHDFEFIEYVGSSVQILDEYDKLNQL